ncbi:MAG: polyprenol monophosphomannose synthase [Candidatus Omnitrophota bacterium]|nr:polyprenol monophosphomannose synthase [Candidatus Omnitrophota bacterium]
MVSIILPTYNESENITDMINGLYRHVDRPLEVIVVDDDSPDGTWKIVQEMENPGIKVVRRTDTRGLATAIKRGLKEAQGDIVGWMDADMCMPPSVLPGMLASLEEFDIAIGSRYAPGGKDARGFFRVLTSRVINSFAILLLGADVKDYDSGFIVLKKKVLDKVAFPSAGYGDYFIELIYKSKKAGFRIKEVPYTFTDREKGESKTAPNILEFFRLGTGYLLRILRLRFSAGK